MADSCLIATQACYTHPPSGSNANKKLYYYANMPSWLLQLKCWSFLPFATSTTGQVLDLEYQTRGVYTKLFC